MRSTRHLMEVHHRNPDEREMGPPPAWYRTSSRWVEKEEEEEAGWRSHSQEPSPIWPERQSPLEDDWDSMERGLLPPRGDGQWPRPEVPSYRMYTEQEEAGPREERQKSSGNLLPLANLREEEASSYNWSPSSRLPKERPSRRSRRSGDVKKALWKYLVKPMLPSLALYCLQHILHCLWNLVQYLFSL